MSKTYQLAKKVNVFVCSLFAAFLFKYFRSVSQQNDNIFMLGRGFQTNFDLLYKRFEHDFIGNRGTVQAINVICILQFIEIFVLLLTIQLGQKQIECKQHVSCDA